MPSSRIILGGSFETCVVPPNPVTRQNKSYNGTAANHSPNIKTKIPMLPITDGIENTKKNILVYSLLMLPIIISPYIVGFAGLTYLVPALALTLYYNYICLSLYKFKKDKFDIRIARQVFSYSILYLFLLFVLFLLDKVI